MKPRPQVWQRIRNSLLEQVTHLEHPLETAGQDPDRIGLAYKRMAIEFPVLSELIRLTHQLDQGTVLSHGDYVRIRRGIANHIISVSRSHKSELQVFSALESLRLLSIIESRVEFPKTVEEIQKEEREKQEKEKKEKDEKDQNQKDKDQEPQWNQPEDKYSPENKDLSNEGQKKSVDILLTDAVVEKRLLRQKIYDQFNLKDWSSIPVSRENIELGRQSTRKLIINTLGEKSIDIPIPYGFALKPGKYSDHEILEVGPGEFKLLSQTDSPITTGLFPVQREVLLALPPRRVSSEEFVQWPKHLLLFVESLRGLSSTEAAARLEKYISEDGGFLYYSKGDKIDGEALSKIDERFSELLTQMPKPMAMAHVGAFNCDGAAWIAALLLRDVLNHPVRIAGGRTSAGTKVINNEKLHVVKSGDPSHAWIEVFDGHRWIPFDPTPKVNAPENSLQPTDVEREAGKPDQDQQSNGSAKDLKEDESKKEKEDAQAEPGEEKNQTDESKNNQEEKPTDLETTSKNLEDLIKAKSTQRSKDDQHLGLIDRVIKQSELLLLEHLIQEGHKTSFVQEVKSVLDGLQSNPNWNAHVERARAKMATLIHDAKFSKFEGLQQLVTGIRLDLRQNQARSAQQRLLIIQRLLLELGEYRNLTKDEIGALHAINEIKRTLETIKHENSKEFDIVDRLLEALPGNISKQWLAVQYGQNYKDLGHDSNLQLASDIVSGKLKSLLQMAAVREFVDMTLNSTLEPKWKEEPTFNRSLMPKPRQDLVITRNPLDFAKMLWSLRPGEHLFSPTLQGRQFAVGSLETRKVIDPRTPIERKISVVYYDVSGSMSDQPIEVQDALLMAYVDKALSETDAIGRPTHELYLVPFNNKLLEGVHISSREDALNYLSKKVNTKTQADGSTDIQAAIENFYEIISASYKNRAAQGRERMFQRANMVLFTDGGSTVNMQSLAEKRRSIPDDVKINMNFVNVGDSVNEVIVKLAENDRLASGKPAFRKLDSQMIGSVAKISAEFDPEAFATNKKVTGPMLTEIDKLLQKVNTETIQSVDSSAIHRNISQIQVSKADIRQMSGLREALNLTKLEVALGSSAADPLLRQRIVQAIVDSYQQITKRSWKDMTYPEKSAFENLWAWARKSN